MTVNAKKISRQKLLNERYRRPLMILITLAAWIVILNSYELFRLSTNEQLFLAWQAEHQNMHWPDYIRLIQLRFWGRILSVCGLSLYSYFAFPRIGITKLYRIIWAIILGFNWLMLLLEFELLSPIYYLNLLSLLALILVVINLRHWLPENAIEAFDL
ncbi:MAG: hypothetical protein Q4P08_00560 [Eubacteriales bacterium]|nr:hypothetical protein [Eubacteriales bacterium]